MQKLINDGNIKKQNKIAVYAVKKNYYEKVYFIRKRDMFEQFF